MLAALILTRKIHEGGNVWSFILEPSNPLSWSAGQFIRVELPHDHPDDEGTRRPFTITSAPHEHIVQIATRITQSSFKQALAALPLGGRLNLLDNPAGDFLWPAVPTRPILLAAQGIGITPFISMLRDRAHRGQPLATTLIHTNLAPDIPFEAEVRAQAKSHPELVLIHANEPLKAATIARLCPQFATHTIYVSGPRLLIELLGPPHNLAGSQIKQDQFPNYPASAY
jgi:ferredoxin-NADP reductase